MSLELAAIMDLAKELARSPTLGEMLQRLVDSAAAGLGVERASVRMLDATGERLLLGARAGEPLHESTISFVPGEGLVGWVAKNGVALRLDDAEADDRFVERPLKRTELGAFLGVPLLDGTSCVGVLSAVHTRLGYFTPQHEAELSLMSALCAPHLCIARLRRLSEVDPLTGALNRRGLDSVYPAPGESSVSSPLSVVTLDLDHFKLVNDEYGHEAGDTALRAVTAVLSGISRKGDAVVRLGGEEFLLVLQGATLSSAQRVAERALAAVASQRIVTAKGTIELTLSAGVAERIAGESRDALLERADAALYQAKRLGRNRISPARMPGSQD